MAFLTWFHSRWQRFGRRPIILVTVLTVAIITLIGWQGWQVWKDPVVSIGSTSGRALEIEQSQITSLISSLDQYRQPTPVSTPASSAVFHNSPAP